MDATNPQTTTDLISRAAPHPAYSVNTVYPLFNFKLCDEDPRFKLWKTIFTDICRSYRVLDHLNGSSLPENENDEEWYSLDSKIKTWMYNSVDANLLDSVTGDDFTAKQIWDNLENFFHNNKPSRSLQLQEKFRNLKKGSSSISDFCRTMKRLADNLKDVDSPITDRELCLQILHNLPDSYNSIVDVISHRIPFPSFSETRNMLMLHESRDTTVSFPTLTPEPQVVLYSQTPRRPDNFRYRGRGRGRNTYRGHGRGSNTGPSPPWQYSSQIPGYNLRPPPLAPLPRPHQFYAGNRASTQPMNFFAGYGPSSTPAQHSAIMPPWAQSFPPAQFNYVGHSPAGHNQQQTQQSSHYSHGQLQNASPTQHFTPVPTNSDPPHQETDISSLFSSMSVHMPDDGWYMDSGATSHISSSHGSQNWHHPPSQ